MKKDNIYNTNSNEMKVLRKRGLTIMYMPTILVYYFGAYYSKNQTIGTIIVVVASLFPLLIYITKIARKTLDEATVNKYIGMISVYNAFVCALLAAYQRGNSVKEILIILAVLCIIILAVIGLLELTCRKIINNPKKTNSSEGAAGTAIIPLAAAAGVFLSKYMRANGIEISYEIVMYVACLIFSIFYLFWMKYRSLSKSQ